MSPPTRYYCTYFDRNYVNRAICLYQSLRDRGGPFRLYALCFDAASMEILKRLSFPEVSTIPVDDLLRGDTALTEARRTRSTVEFYFTATPSLPLYVLNHYPEVDRITYVDADLYYFADPERVFDEAHGASIAIIAHGFPPALASRVIYGKYNVGWLSFNRDVEAVECLTRWREQCLDWCYDRVEEGRFADQKYLDDWPQRFKSVVVLEHPGANLAPWNLGARRLTEQEGRVHVDGRPLLFFHFHGLRRSAPRVWNTRLGEYGVQMTPLIRRRIYRPYLAALGAAVAEVAVEAPGNQLKVGAHERHRYTNTRWLEMPRRFARTGREAFRGLRRRQYLLEPRQIGPEA
ncbi:MAG TPA: hypothetical protein VNV65_02390 [Candidatus Solibacter sp.]|jgi:hypothetical protein|nr:hypothetical protein [Candidatus Solibacter sp.]